MSGFWDSNRKERKRVYGGCKEIVQSGVHESSIKTRMEWRCCFPCQVTVGDSSD